MNIDTELHVKASEDLEKEVKAELEKDTEELSVASLKDKQEK